MPQNHLLEAFFQNKVNCPKLRKVSLLLLHIRAPCWRHGHINGACHPCIDGKGVTVQRVLRLSKAVAAPAEVAFPVETVKLNLERFCTLRSRRSTNRVAVDKLHAWRELDHRLGIAASQALLLGAMDDGVNLGDVESLWDEVADVVCDHGAVVRAGLCVVVRVALEASKTLPAEVVAAVLA